MTIDMECITCSDIVVNSVKYIHKVSKGNQCDYDLYSVWLSGAEACSEDDLSGEEEDLSLLTKDGPIDTLNNGKGKREKKKAKKTDALQR